MCGVAGHLGCFYPGFPAGSVGKESTYKAGDLGWEDPLEEEVATHSGILPGKSHGQRSLAGPSAQVASGGRDLATKPLPPLLPGGAARPPPAPQSAGCAPSCVRESWC